MRTRPLLQLVLVACLVAVSAGSQPGESNAGTSQATPTPQPVVPTLGAESNPGLTTPEQRQEIFKRLRKEAAAAKQKKGCLELAAAGEERRMEALLACRQELEKQPESLELMKAVAGLEFAAGNAKRSAELWQQLIDRQGWTAELARNHAQAVWRSGDTAQAEKLMRTLLERAPSELVYHDLLRFFSSFGRYQEAADLAGSAAKAFPGDCSFLELEAAAEADLEHPDTAVKLVKRAVDAACPAFRWTTLPGFAQRLTQAPYQKLLRPADLAKELRQLDDTECLRRFELLKPVITPKQAPAVTEEVLLRDRADVRYTGLGLVTQLGARALDSWRRLLAADVDPVLHRNVLRRIREINDPAFIPLLEDHLERETLPLGRNLTQLVLGELLLTGGDAERGKQLLEGIPKNDDHFPPAQLKLSEVAEKRGDYRAAYEHIERARAVKPDVYVDPQRVERIRKLAGVPDPTPTPKAVATPVTPPAP